MGFLMDNLKFSVKIIWVFFFIHFWIKRYIVINKIKEKAPTEEKQNFHFLLNFTVITNKPCCVKVTVTYYFYQ